MDNRQKSITKNVDLAGCGLEIAPLFRPVVSKDDYNVYYTDYTSTEVLREKNATNITAHSGVHPGIQTLDFVWSPGSKLAESVPLGVEFDYAVASHVIEHVPNMVGWLNEILSVLKVGGKLALVIPNKAACFDYYRQETPVAEFVEAWICNASKPSPKQIFDCLSLAVVDTDPPGTRSFDLNLPLSEAKRIYTLDQALSYAINSYSTNEYLDVHCSAFTPDSFVNVVTTLVDLGLLNVSLSATDQGEPSVDGATISGEFMVTLTKLGEPRVRGGAVAVDGFQKGAQETQARTAFLEAIAIQDVLKSDIARFVEDANHARRAFLEAVSIQDELKQHITCLEGQMGFVSSVKRSLLKLIGKRRASRLGNLMRGDRR